MKLDGSGNSAFSVGFRKSAPWSAATPRADRARAITSSSPSACIWARVVAASAGRCRHARPDRERLTPRKADAP